MIAPANYLTDAESLNAMNRDQAYERVVETHYDSTYGYARSLAYNEADAQDLTQHAFLKLKTHLRQIRDWDRIKGWLFSTVRRKFINGYRHRHKFPKVSLDGVESFTAPPTASGATRLDAQKVMAGLQVLPEKYRAPLAMFYFEQRSYKEIAAALDIPIGTVMSRLRRAKDQLRDWFENAPDPKRYV